MFCVRYLKNNLISENLFLISANCAPFKTKQSFKWSENSLKNSIVYFAVFSLSAKLKKKIKTKKEDPGYTIIIILW